MNRLSSLQCFEHNKEDCKKCWKKIFSEQTCYPHQLKACHYCYPVYFDNQHSSKIHNGVFKHKCTVC